MRPSYRNPWIGLVEELSVIFRELALGLVAIYDVPDVIVAIPGTIYAGREVLEAEVASLDARKVIRYIKRLACNHVVRDGEDRPLSHHRNALGAGVPFMGSV